MDSLLLLLQQMAASLASGPSSTSLAQKRDRSCQAKIDVQTGLGSSPEAHLESWFPSLAKLGEEASCLDPSFLEFQWWPQAFVRPPFRDLPLLSGSLGIIFLSGFPQGKPPSFKTSRLVRSLPTASSAPPHHGN